MNTTVAPGNPPGNPRVVQSAAGQAAFTAASVRRWLCLICVIHLAMSAWFGSMKFDQDEFAFVPESYLILGGDYASGYVKDGDYAGAASVALRSYYFFWKYRPMNAPLIDEDDRSLFATEEQRFGYSKPARLKPGEHDSLSNYKQRLIVTEPDRFYHHGAGKPLLSAVASIPQLALVKLLTPSGRTLLDYQFNSDYHPLFLVSRLVQVAAGLATVLLTYLCVRRVYDAPRALTAAALVGFFPLAIKYFPNIHHDALLAPLVLATIYFYASERYRRAGVFLGLALAAKNTAIFMLPVLMLFAATRVWHSRGTDRAADPKTAIGPQWRGFMLACLLGLVVLTPFANPISYAREILTPLTNRAYDTRGENVAGFTLSGQFQRSADSAGNATAMRPEVALAQRVSRVETSDFFFAALAVLMLLTRASTPLAQLATLMLLVALPLHALVFGYGMTYRYLMFLPFFAIVCVDRIPVRRLSGLIAVLLVIDALYCIDPLTADASHKMRSVATSGP